jgi:hypothetical protein
VNLQDSKSESLSTNVVFLKRKRSQTVVAHAFNLSTWEAEAGGCLSSRPAWSTEFQDSQGYTKKACLEKHGGGGGEIKLTTSFASCSDIFMDG